MDKKYWYIKRSDIFSSMSHEEMERLAQLSTMCEFSKGSTVYLPDEPSEHAYLLKEGAKVVDGRLAVVVGTVMVRLFFLMPVLVERYAPDALRGLFRHPQNGKGTQKRVS